MRLLLASNNAKKRAELSLLLAPLAIEVVVPSEIGGISDVDEDRDTFEGNAAKKAVSAANTTGMWTLADDSGLEVEALGNAPGVRSARFAGEPSDDARNNAKLLRELDGLTGERRRARFVCALALADPSGNLVAEIRGEARGQILESARGTSGFGYDPLFLFDEESQPECGRTFAELSSGEKSLVSHRGRALAQLTRILPGLINT